MTLFGYALFVGMILFCAILFTLALARIPRRRPPSELERTLAEMENEERVREWEANDEAWHQEQMREHGWPYNQ